MKITFESVDFYDKTRTHAMSWLHYIEDNLYLFVEVEKESV